MYTDVKGRVFTASAAAHVSLRQVFNLNLIIEMTKIVFNSTFLCYSMSVFKSVF